MSKLFSTFTLSDLKKQTTKVKNQTVYPLLADYKSVNKTNFIIRA